MHDDEPELAGYEPYEGRPLRSPHVVRVMRVFVLLGIVGLVLPGILTTWSVAAASAKEACRRWVAYENPGAPGSHVQFELMTSNGPSWQCYTSGAFGGDSLVASLGMIPGPPHLPARKPVSS